MAMTDPGIPEGQNPPPPRPADGTTGRVEAAETTDGPYLTARWRPDTYGGSVIGRPVAGRRIRRGCWLLMIVLLLICCVLSAWLTDSILDLRAITTGG